MKRLFRRCGHAPGTLTPEDQAAVDQFRALLAALRDMAAWTPGLYKGGNACTGPRSLLRPGAAPVNAIA
ncbi:hypothetical protein ABZ876_36930 [Streptomyces sp. NPDC046931]|uniref:hypothetical protein n=1 Tax=Streptomyces sp. NPDC046931 TaxID=3154806 RepID=UPI0033E1ED15